MLTHVKVDVREHSRRLGLRHAQCVEYDAAIHTVLARFYRGHVLRVVGAVHGDANLLRSDASTP